MAHAGFPNGLGIAAEEIEKELEHDSDETGRRLIIEDNGILIGEMSYRNLGESTAEIGIKICDATKQEKGYGKILLRLLINKLFSMGYEQIVLDTNLNNKRAQHVYEELGFEKVRVNIDSWTDQLGVKQSSVDYKLYREQFIQL
nr:GNAT family N-acetyltransferase [Anaerosporobacter sp.]